MSIRIDTLFEELLSPTIGSDQTNLLINYLVVEYGINAKDSKGAPLLCRAVQSNNQKLIELLLEKNADINAVTDEGFTALICAAQQGNTDLVDFLLKHHANVNAKNKFDDTALHWASGPKGNINIVSLLLEKQAEVNAKENTNYNTPLMLATLYGHTEIVALLLEHQAEVNVTEKTNHFTPLLQAIKQGYQEIVALLLKNQADLHIRDINNYTPLMWASGRAHVDIIKYLLESGAALEDKDNISKTALFHALCSKKSAAIEFLISRGADISHDLAACEPFMINSAQLCFNENRILDAIALLKQCIKLYPSLVLRANMRLAQCYLKLSQDPSYTTPIDASYLDEAFLSALKLDIKTLSSEEVMLRDTIISLYLSNQPASISEQVLPLLNQAYQNPTAVLDAIQRYQSKIAYLNYSASKSQDLFKCPVVEEAPKKRFNFTGNLKKIVKLKYLLQKIFKRIKGDKLKSIPKVDKDNEIEKYFKMANDYLLDYNNPRSKSSEVIERALQMCLFISSTDENGFYYRFKEQIINIYFADKNGNSPDHLPHSILDLIKTSHQSPQLSFDILKGDKQLQDKLSPAVLLQSKTVSIPPSLSSPKKVHIKENKFNTNILGKKINLKKPKK